MTPLPYRVPLTGTVLIEASAGTGKTHTLERLMARHILWQGHTIADVLAVTFTNAATADIKLRLHRFLTRCFEYDGGADDDIEHLFAGKPDSLDDAALRTRLASALADFDRAAVYTIHGFCQRLIQDYALDMAQAIPSPALLEDESALRLQVCEEFWRRYGQDPQFCDLLDAALGSPPLLVRQLADLLTTAELKPDKPVLRKPPLEAAFARLSACFQAHKAGALAALEQALAQEALHKSDFRSVADIETRFAELEAFLAKADLTHPQRFHKLCFSGIREKKNKTKPDNPLFHQLEDWHAAIDAFEQYQRDCRVFLFHELRHFARDRLAELKRERHAIGFNDIIETVHFALENDTEGRLAEKIRAAYPVALVDEFQDTDERQWRIFERIYRGAGPASLVLIGDPKQAIYGFRGGDIHTYLKVQALAEHKESLAFNYRSNQSLLDGIESVFLARHAHPFPEPGIPFVHVTAGRAGESLHLDGQQVPALGFFGPSGRQEAGIVETRIACARQCADAIADLLNRGQSGTAMVVHADAHRALIADDIAVLVSKHQEAQLMRSQLQRRGVAAVCVRRDSLFDCYEAMDILQILHALEHPGSYTAVMSACSGRLLRAAGRCRVEDNDWPVLAQKLSLQGPLAAFTEVLDAAATVLLPLPDGERQLANYCQVLERMQRRFCPARSSDYYLGWLARQISRPDTSDAEAAVHPNLESSKPRVRIMTLHQSKGLEFGMVFLPFSAIHSNPASRFARYFDGSKRCLHLDARNADVETRSRIDAEQASENLRLLYVGMTRAKFALRCGWARVKRVGESALGYLLLPESGAADDPYTEAVAGFSHERAIPHCERVHTPVSVSAQPVLAAFQSNPVPWQISSFSSLHRSQEVTSVKPADDETTEPAPTGKSPFAGANFGNALHQVLEHAQPAEWPSGQPGEAAMAQCRAALIAFGYAPDLALQGAPTLAALASNTLLAELPENIRLIDLGCSDKRHELEFHLRLSDADGSAVLALLQRFGYCLERDRLGFNLRLNGLLTGKIDLLYRHRDKLHVLDYKSNALPDYGPDSLQQSITDNEYDLQYLLYTVAVHRWLRFSRPDYAFSRHFGGVRYLYARGLDARFPGRGVFSDLPAEDLILALDRCFSAEGEWHG